MAEEGENKPVKLVFFSLVRWHMGFGIKFRLLLDATLETHQFNKIILFSPNLCPLHNHMHFSRIMRIADN